RPSGLEPGDGHPERRAGHIVELALLEEVHGLRISTVLATDADLEIGLGLAALIGADANQSADALLVDRLEGGEPEDAGVEVAREEARLDVVPREAPRRLGEVVRAEREEVRRLRDLARRE